MSPGGKGKHVKYRFSSDHLIMAFFLVVVVSSAADLIADYSEGVTLSHLIQEATVMLIAMAAIAWLALRLRRSRREIAALHRELQTVQEMLPRQSEDIISVKNRLAQVIAHHFEQWRLTNSEQEVGLLLIKGFSLKEISALRGVTEKTVRHQASSIYKKAGLPGRHAFSAWFIEDIL